MPGDWVEEFCCQYPRAVGLPFFCNVRANLVTREMMRQLKRVGCASVGMGIETADDRLRNELRQVENLKKLFAIAVEWPWLLPLVRWLIRWPRNGLFRLAYKLWKGFAIKQRIHPYRPSLVEYVETIQRFMRFD